MLTRHDTALQMAFAATALRTQLGGTVRVTVDGTPFTLTRHTEIAISAAPAPGMPYISILQAVMAATCSLSTLLY
jgi:hypothetical protein